jgi:hypothetical protein
MDGFNTLDFGREQITVPVTDRKSGSIHYSFHAVLLRQNSSNRSLVVCSSLSFGSDIQAAVEGADSADGHCEHSNHRLLRVRKHSRNLADTDCVALLPYCHPASFRQIPSGMSGDLIVCNVKRQSDQTPVMLVTGHSIVWTQGPPKSCCRARQGGC